MAMAVLNPSLWRRNDISIYFSKFYKINDSKNLKRLICRQIKIYITKKP